MAIFLLSFTCFLYTLSTISLSFASYPLHTGAPLPVLPPPPPSPQLLNLNCTASRCGSLFNITFPFSTTASANMSSQCGLPEFRLICNKTHLSWWPEHLLSPLSSILTITANHITSGTFVTGPPPFSSPIDACSPVQEHQFFSHPTSLPLGLQFSPQENILLLTNCSKDRTSRLQVNETVDGFSFSSPSCLQYYSVCSNHSSNAALTRVSCFEAISVDANSSFMSKRYECPSNITIYELPTKENRGLSLQIAWTISQSYYDCKACEHSNGSCTINNVTDSFQCSCPNNGNSSGSPSSICSSAKTSKPCRGLCQSYVQFFLGATAIAVAILIVGSSFGVYCCRKKARLIYMHGGRQAIPTSTLDSPSKDHLQQMLAFEYAAFPHFTRRFSYKELCAATNGFADSGVLGDGGFGTVYEGTLACSGEKVAVKRLFAENAQRIEQFLNEIRILSTLRHPNLVRLHGFCCESVTELLLVYEFASNGSLADNLHGIAGKANSLSWEMRLCIALETAGALAYMHERDPPIFHRDVKSSNILLDGDFHAKLADFGLSRRVYGTRSAAHVSTGPQGTPGYVDPQYQQCYRLTDKSDVYSFGVVLMELISGKAPVDMSRRHTEHINLSSLAVAKIQTGALDELIDPCLLQEEKGALHAHDTVARVAELAFLCLAPMQEDRPSMREVALTLLDIARSLSLVVSTVASLDE